MLPTLKEINLSSAIVRQKCIDNLLVVIDNKNNLCIIHLKKQKVLKTLKLFDTNRDFFDFNRKAVAISPKLEVFVTSEKTKQSYVLKIDSIIQKRLTFRYSEYEITQSLFVEESPLLLIADEQGRSYLVNTEDGSLTHELPRVADTISAVATSKDGKYCAIGNYKGLVIVVNVHNGKRIAKITGETPVEGLCIADNNDLIVVYRNNTIIRHDISKNCLLAQIELDLKNDWCSAVFLGAEDKILFVGTKNSNLFTLHTKSLQNIFHLNLQRGGITSMELSKEFFVVGFSSGNISLFRYKDHEDEFIRSVELLDIKAAGLLLKKNIFLIIHEKNKDIYESWLEKVDTITMYLSQTKTKEAYDLASPYLYHPKCQKEYEKLQESATALTVLSTFVKAKDYKNAYKAVAEHPELKESIFYKRLEFVWNNLLKKALKELSSDPIRNKEVAQNILDPFKEVPEKQVLIDQLIANANVFVDAKKVVDARDFKRYFSLVEQFEFLQETLLHQKVLNLSNQLLDKVNTLIDEKAYPAAVQVVNILKNFAPAYESALRLEEIIQILTKIDAAIKSGDIFKALELEGMIDLSSSFSTLLDLKIAIKGFANKQIVSINSNKLEEVFDNALKLLGYPYSAPQGKQVIRTYYQHEMLTAFRFTKDAINWEKTLQNYLKFFQADETIYNLVKDLDMDAQFDAIQTDEKKSTDYVDSIIVIL